MKTFETLKDLAESGYLFRIQDNGGATADRYTVVTSDGDYLSMSFNPSHPQGVSQFGEGIDPRTLQAWHEEAEAVDMALGDLPPNVALHVLYRLNEAWSDHLGAIEAGLPRAVAGSRSKAKANDGMASDAGIGIYLCADGFMIRRDDDGDTGPHLTAPAALIASLPQDYGLSGSECHSTVDVSRLEASPEVAAAVAALEARIEAGLHSGPSPSR